MAFDKKVHVNSLIGHGFEESDRAWLEAMPDAQLQKINPTTPAPAPVPAAVTQPAPVAANQTVTPTVTLEHLVANADPATQAMFADMKASHEREKKILVTKILGCATNQFPEPALNGMALPNLRAIAALVPDQQNQMGVYDLSQPIPGMNGAYAGAVGYVPQVGNASPLEDPALPPEMTFDAPRNNA